LKRGGEVKEGQKIVTKGRMKGRVENRNKRGDKIVSRLK
jgi:hypothetical protein